MKFFVSVTEHLGWKFSDYVYMLVLCQKLHNFVHMPDNFFSSDRPLRRPLALTASQSAGARTAPEMNDYGPSSRKVLDVARGHVDNS